jgi:hypothetical protein
MLRGTCGHSMDTASRDAVAAQPALQLPAMSTSSLPGVVAGPAIALTACVAPLVDARGAPHLTSVIRI